MTEKKHQVGIRLFAWFKLTYGTNILGVSRSTDDVVIVIKRLDKVLIWRRKLYPLFVHLYNVSVG